MYLAPKMLTNVYCTCAQRATLFSLATLSHACKWSSSHTDKNRYILRWGREDWKQNMENLVSCGSEMCTTLTESLRKKKWYCLWSGCQTVQEQVDSVIDQWMSCWKGRNTSVLSARRLHVVPSIGKRGQIQLFRHWVAGFQLPQQWLVNEKRYPAWSLLTFPSKVIAKQDSMCEKILPCVPSTTSALMSPGAARNGISITCCEILSPRCIKDGLSIFEPGHTLSRFRDDHDPHLTVSITCHIPSLSRTTLSPLTPTHHFVTVSITTVPTFTHHTADSIQVSWYWHERVAEPTGYRPLEYFLVQWMHQSLLHCSLTLEYLTVRWMHQNLPHHSRFSCHVRNTDDETLFNQQKLKSEKCAVCHIGQGAIGFWVRPSELNDDKKFRHNTTAL